MVKVKKIGISLILLLFLVGSFGFLFVSSANGDDSSGVSSDAGIFKAFSSKWFSDRWEIWKLGSGNLNQSQIGMLAETAKYLALIIVSLVIYGTFSAMQFPSSTPLRLLLSIVVGLLGTFMITTEELLTTLVSYGALTTTLLIAVPFISLLGMTIMFIYKANAPGLYAAKILWAVFAFFLLFKAAVLILLLQNFGVYSMEDGNYNVQLMTSSGNIPNYVVPFVPMKKVTAVGEGKISYDVDNEKLGKMIGNTSLSTAWVLLATSLAILWFIVFNGKLFAWLQKEARESAVEAAKSNIQLSAARDKLQADAMRDVAKTGS